MATIVNEALQAAFGLPGQSGDPEAILYAAHRLAATYRTALEWKLEFERLDVPEEMETLRLLTGSFCDNMVAEVEEFSHTLKRSIPDAVARAQAGQRVELKLTLKLTVPDRNQEYQHELQRIEGLIQSGMLGWD